MTIPIVRSISRLRAKAARGESRSDLARVRAKTEAELERDIAADPDFAGISDDWLAIAKAFRPVTGALKRK